jgi:putative DNA primase/helicase
MNAELGIGQTEPKALAKPPNEVTQAALATVYRYGDFQLGPDGVSFLAKDKDPEMVCGWLEVTAQSRDESGEEWGYALRWKDPDGRVHTWSAPRTLIVKHTSELAEALARGGLNIVPGKGNKVKKYIASVQPTKRVLNVPRQGWYTFGSGPNARRVFVLPDQTLKPKESAGEEVILQRESYDGTARRVAGTLFDWQAGVANLCVGNELLVFATSIALASPTLNLLSKDSGGFHLHGLSSTGKSTALFVASSVWGFPVQTWRTTDNALEDTAERHNDTLLPLDELSQVDPRKAAEVAYMLGNGEGKQRLTQSITPQRKKTWRLLLLSTGEITLAGHAESVGQTPKAGTEVRMVNIDADAGHGMGLFRNVHSCSEPSAFADMLKTKAKESQGTAGPAFVAWIIAHYDDTVETLKRLIKEFKDKHVQPGSSGEVYRVAERFAVVGAAGELATQAGITGWSQGTAIDSAAWCYKSWLSTRSTGSSDMDKAVDAIKAFLMAHESRFEWLHTETNTLPLATSIATGNRAGFRRSVAEGGEATVEYLVPTETLRDMCQGHDVKKVAKELAKRGHLRRQEDRLQVQHRVGDKGLMRFYAIRSSIFNDGKTDEEEKAA